MAGGTAIVTKRHGLGLGLLLVLSADMPASAVALTATVTRLQTQRWVSEGPVLLSGGCHQSGDHRSTQIRKGVLGLTCLVDEEEPETRRAFSGETPQGRGMGSRHHWVSAAHLAPHADCSTPRRFPA